jgi:hypothetical protein
MKWVLLAAVLIVVLVILEGKRQERKYGRSGGGSAMRAGLDTSSPSERSRFFWSVGSRRSQ